LRAGREIGLLWLRAHEDGQVRLLMTPDRFGSVEGVSATAWRQEVTSANFLSVAPRAETLQRARPSI
jgi:hypothetical protein